LRICIITSSYPRNAADSINAGVFVRDFARTLHQLGQTVFVLTPQKHGEMCSSDEFEVHFFKWFGGETSLSHLNPRSLKDFPALSSVIVQGTVQALKFIQKKRIDMVLAMWALPSGLYAYLGKKRLGIPYTVWALGSDIWMAHKYPLGTTILRGILKEASLVFADGYQLASDTELVSGSPCHFLPSSRILPKKSNLIPKIVRGKKNLVFVGRFHPNKGVDVLIDALDEVITKRDDVFLHIFGDGPLAPTIERKIQEYNLANYVALHGYAAPETVTAYFKSCDALLIPSRIESIPVIFSDAVQVQIPIVATKVGDLERLITKHDIGRLAEPGDPKSFGNAIIDFLNEDTERFKTNLNQLKEQFDIESSAIKYLSMVEGALRQ